MTAPAGVLEALQCACSQDPSVLKVGEEQLKAWEKENGFYTALAVSLLYSWPGNLLNIASSLYVYIHGRGLTSHAKSYDDSVITFIFIPSRLFGSHAELAHIYHVHAHTRSNLYNMHASYILYNKYVPRSISIFTYKTTPPLPRPPLIKSVISERELDASVRWMAITFIKNGVERYWRPGAPK